MHVRTPYRYHGLVCLFNFSYTSFCSNDNTDVFETTKQQVCKAANQYFETMDNQADGTPSESAEVTPLAPRSGSTLALILGTLLVFGEVVILNIVTNFI